MTAKIPSSTYRLQFNRYFTFQQAKELVPYLSELGITDVYASPIFRAVAGSVHGYDVCSHNELNPEVGTHEEFCEFASELQKHGMGLILDFVPNHMGIGEFTNTWWMDVLENGPSSLYAHYFDIDWHPVKTELENRVLLPILGEQYGRVLENGELKLSFEEGAFLICYNDHKLPIDPQTTIPLLVDAQERLKHKSGETSPELDSIVFALEHLPSRTDINPQSINERAREKQAVHARLTRLCKENPQVQAMINEVVSKLQKLDCPEALDRYEHFISAQAYRLASWKVAGEEINYRRFFDINSLAAIRMEVPEVFEETHKYLFEIAAHPAVCGIRIDHIDGLYDPRAYLNKLQEAFASMRGDDPANKPLYLLVEKILGAGESLRTDWPIYGTTGYEVGNQITELLVNPTTESAFNDIYNKFTDFRWRYDQVVYESKLLVMKTLMPSEVNTLGQMLNRISETNRWYRDFTLNSLTEAIREVIACFPVYRTYFTPESEAVEADLQIVGRAISAAKRLNPQMDRSVFDFLKHVLTPGSEELHPVDAEARRAFVMKFQQCTGPITAKGVEDTSFYIFNRLVALNEVGGEPGVFGCSTEAFHQKNIRRLEATPHSLIATSTHDTKRSEDVRARIAVLSEIPQEWGRAIRRWHTVNRKYLQEVGGKMAPDSNESYLLYQILLGTYPLHSMSSEEREQYISRIQEYMVKAIHEAKVNSCWTDTNESWQEAVKDFIRLILTPGRPNRFLTDFESLVERIGQHGRVNSMTQTVLKLTVPGVPDIYQGQELWDDSLVDPDNRRLVDYPHRSDLLKQLKDSPPTCDDMLQNWQDGRLKLFLTQRLLRFRREHADLFMKGSYEPVALEGEFADHAVAFIRSFDEKQILVIVPRHAVSLGSSPMGDVWLDTQLTGAAARFNGRDLFTGKAFPGENVIRLSDALTNLPVAVFVRTTKA